MSKVDVVPRGFHIEDGKMVDDRPHCYVCERPIDWERRVMKEYDAKTKTYKRETIDVAPLSIGHGLYRHRGEVSPKCEPDSHYYIEKFGHLIRPDLLNALIEGKKEKEMAKDAKKEEQGKEKVATVKVSDEMKTRIMETNKQLANAIDGGKSSLIEAYQKKVKKLVAEVGGDVYTVDELGYAVQAKSTAKKPTAAPKADKPAKEKKEPRTPKSKTLRACGCGCGEMVTGYFKMGHDGRVKGMFLKVEK